MIHQYKKPKFETLFDGLVVEKTYKMPNGRPRNRHSRHANTRRNRDAVIACAVSDDTPVVQGEVVVATASQDGGFAPSIEDSVPVEMFNDLIHIHEELKTAWDAKTAAVKAEEKAVKKTSLSREKVIKHLEQKLKIKEGEYDYLFGSYKEFGEELKLMGYVSDTSANEMTIRLDGKMRPKKNPNGCFNHAFDITMLTRGEHAEMRDKTKSCKDLIKEVEDSGGKVVTLDMWRDEINGKIDLMDKQTEFIEKLKKEYSDFAKEVMDNPKMEKRREQCEIGTQTDEACFYDTDMNGWGGF